MLTGRITVFGVVEVSAIQIRGCPSWDVPALKLLSQAGDSAAGLANIPDTREVARGRPGT